MTTRTADRIDQNNNTGKQQSVYNFGSSSSKLDVSTSDAKIDTGDIIYTEESGGEATFTNDHATETVTIKMMVSENEDDYDTNPERFAQVGDDTDISPDTSKTVRWEGRYPYIQFLKSATGAITGGLYGVARCNGYNP